MTHYLTDAQAHNKIQSHGSKNAKLFKPNCFFFFFTEKQAAEPDRDLKGDSPFCLESLLSATFLSAEAMASEGMRGLSTYLGFLLGPVSMNQRYRGRERGGERNELREADREKDREGERKRGRVLDGLTCSRWD